MSTTVRLKLVLALLGTVVALAARAASPTLAERLDRAERFQDWAAVEKLSRSFVMARRGDLYALTAILNACVVRGCDEAALVARLRGPLVSDGVREFARAWLEYVARDPAAARPRFEALSRNAQTAWLGAFGRLAYASDARNVSLLREALGDARSDRDVAAELAEDIRNAEMTLASLEDDEARVMRLAKEGAGSGGALMARFGRELAADDFAAAEKTLGRYARLWGEDQDLVLARIELVHARRPPAEAAARARRELAAQPRYWRLRLSLARALIDADDEAGARAALAEGFPVEFASVRMMLATLPADFGGVARDDLAAYARRMEPFRDFPESQAALATAMLDAGRPEEAASFLDRADASSPALSETLQLRARMAREAGRDEEWLGLLERIAARTPREVGAQLALGYAYVKAGHPGKALRVVAALRRSPRYVRPESLELIEKSARDAESSFRTAHRSDVQRNAHGTTLVRLER